MHCCFTYKPVVWAHSTVNHTNTFRHHLYLEVYDKNICDLSFLFVIQNNLQSLFIHEQWLKEDDSVLIQPPLKMNFNFLVKKSFTKLSRVDLKQG